MNMKKSSFYVLALACGLVAGCTTKARSISHSAYPEQEPNGPYGNRTSASDPAFDYRGELSEFDVLGISRGDYTSDADIRRALDASRAVKLRPGASILLIQSGAFMPDGEMVAEMSKHFRVSSFSGIPTVRRAGFGGLQTESADPESYSRSLRLTAARGGAEYIVCYWGLLESESDHLATKTISWVPFVKWVTPDEKQHMRIHVKVALVDVRTGDWSVFSSKPFDDARLSTSPRRAAADQKQVELLKKLAYEDSVTELVRNYN